MKEQPNCSLGRRLTVAAVVAGLVGLVVPATADAGDLAKVKPGQLVGTKAGAAKKIKFKRHSNALYMTWKASASAIRFKVVVARDKKMKSVVFKSGLQKRKEKWIKRDKTTSDKRLEEGTKYWVQIVSYDAKGKVGKKSKAKSTTTRLRAPGKVFDVRTQGVDSGSLRLSWQAARNPTGYRVELFTKPKGTAVATYLIPGAKTTTTTLKNLGSASIKPGQLFFAKVSASRFNKAFGESNQYAAALPFARPASRVAFKTQVASYNVVFSAAKDGAGRDWDRRKALIANRLKGMSIVGLQELAAIDKSGRSGVNDIAELTGLTRVAPWGGRCPQRAVDILYNAAKYDLSSCELTPLTAGKWLIIADLVDKASRTHFIVANTHFLNGDSAAARKTRSTQAKEVVAALARANPKGLPMILVGDFNAPDIKSDTDSAPLTISHAGYVSSDLVAVHQSNFQYASFHGWDRAYTTCQRVDHIWLNRLVVADSFKVHVGAAKNEPSDHFVISAGLTVHRAS